MLDITITSLLLIVFMLSPAMAAAIAPPKEIAERNLKADFIAVGKVLSIHERNTPPHFVFKALHIIKGFGEIKKGDNIRVLFRLQPLKTLKFTRHVQGILPVKVKAESLVVVYIERSESHSGYFNPLLEGLSVITIK